MNQGLLKSWLKNTHHVLVPDDWLHECTQWLLEENQGSTVSNNAFQQMIYEQWLVSDLRELACSCIPSSVKSAEKFILDGYYCLQIDSLSDVSTPYYGQLQKVKGTENENVNVTATQEPSQAPWQKKSSRMIMMQLTDGVNETQAMEYQHIPCLNLSLPPGVKVLIHGKVLCRLGVMMLKKENIRILGGEVEDLVNENSQIKVIEKSLKSNTERDRSSLSCPKLINENNNQSHSKLKENDKKVAKNLKNTQIMQSSVSEEIDDWDADLNDDDLEAALGQINTDESNRSIINSTGFVDRSSINFHENLTNNVEFDDDFSDQIPSRVAHNSKYYPMTTSSNMSLSHQPPMPTLSNMSLSHQPPMTTSSNMSSPHQTSINSSIQGHITNRDGKNDSGQMSNFDLDGDFMDSDDEEFSAYISNTKRKRIGLDNSPWTYLSIIKKNWPSSSDLHLKIKGFVSTLTSKLESNQGRRWSLRVMINDGSAAMEVDLGNEMLCELIGFSSQDSLKLKLEAREDVSIKKRVMEAISSVQRKLIDLCAIFEVFITPEHERPTVIKTISLTEDHLRELKQNCIF